jgi:hypothetical protein
LEKTTQKGERINAPEPAAATAAIARDARHLEGTGRKNPGSERAAWRVAASCRGCVQEAGRAEGSKERRIEEGNLTPDHDRIMIPIAPKYAQREWGDIKGKSAIHLARIYAE